jgi:hypothetical protein
MLSSDDVIDVERKVVRSLRHETVFAR